MVELKAITEDNFINTFNLKLADGPERYVEVHVWSDKGILKDN